MYCGKHLRFLRISKNLSQKDIAERLQLKEQAVSKWEKKKSLDHHTIDRYLSASGTTLKELNDIIKIIPPDK